MAEVQQLKVDAQHFPITHVSLYVDRAEVKRTIKASGLKEGSCDLRIEHLPSALQHDSLRIDGAASGASMAIHDVALSVAPKRQTETSDELAKLKTDLETTQDAIRRAEAATTALQSFANTLHCEHVDIRKVAETLEGFETEMSKWQTRIADIKRQRVNIEDAIAKETQRLKGDGVEELLRTIATVKLVITDVSDDIEIELHLIYIVSQASWEPKYDIRVRTDMPEAAPDKKDVAEKPVKLAFKAIVKQNSGEPWANVPLTLETSTPTFGRELPVLHPWTLSIRPPQPSATLFGSVAPQASVFAAAPVPPSPVAAPHKKRMAVRAAITTAAVSTTGQSSSFVVPGRVTVQHSGHSMVSIAVLDLPARLIRSAVPSLDSSVHLRARIDNQSEYTFLPGHASVYLDGAFVASTHLRAVNPGETFGCSLGTDETLRITTRPQVRKTAISGLVSKTRTTSISQSYSIVNASSTRFLSSLLIYDHLPISSSEKIAVNLTSPALPPLISLNHNEPAHWIRLSKDDRSTVSARWASATSGDAENDEKDEEAVGQDGKIEWRVSLAPKAKTTISLAFEVHAPADARIDGL